jgi:hypothetical protein
MGNFHIWGWLWAVISQWAALATGGIIMGIIALYETLKEKPINKKLMLGVFVFFLLVAMYKAWYDQYEKADAAGKANDAALRQTHEYKLSLDSDTRTINSLLTDLGNEETLRHKIYDLEEQEKTLKSNLAISLEFEQKFRIHDNLWYFLAALGIQEFDDKNYSNSARLLSLSFGTEPQDMQRTMLWPLYSADILMTSPHEDFYEGQFRSNLDFMITEINTALKTNNPQYFYHSESNYLGEEIRNLNKVKADCPITASESAYIDETILKIYNLQPYTTTHAP